jgi:hypothetical protein
MTGDLGRRSFLKQALGAAGVGAGLLQPWLRTLASYPPCTPTGAVWGDLPAPPTGQQPIWAAPLINGLARPGITSQFNDLL